MRFLRLKYPNGAEKLVEVTEAEAVVLLRKPWPRGEALRITPPTPEWAERLHALSPVRHYEFTIHMPEGYKL